MSLFGKKNYRVPAIVGGAALVGGALALAKRSRAKKKQLMIDIQMGKDYRSRHPVVGSQSETIYQPNYRDPGYLQMKSMLGFGANRLARDLKSLRLI